MAGTSSLPEFGPALGKGLEVFYFEKEAPSRPESESLLAYWKSCAQKGEFVMGRDVPSRPIAPIMKHLMVIEPVGEDYRLRIVGAAPGERIGRNLTSMLLSEILSEESATRFKVFLTRSFERDYRLSATPMFVRR